MEKGRFSVKQIVAAIENDHDIGGGTDSGRGAEITRSKVSEYGRARGPALIATRCDRGAASAHDRASSASISISRPD